MNVTHYSTALVELLRTTPDPDRVLLNLRAYLDQRGQRKLHRNVLQAVLQKLEEYQRKNRALVRLRDQSELADMRCSLENDCQTLLASAEYVTVSDSTVIGGYSIATQDKRIDKTYKKQLLAIYNAATREQHESI